MTVRVAILVPHFKQDDAVGADVRGMFAALSDRYSEKISVRVYANDWESSHQSVYHASAIEDWCKQSRDIILYHYTVPWQYASDLLDRTPAKKVVRYHNVTPPEFFEAYSLQLAEMCRLGQAEWLSLLKLPLDMILSPSEFNLSGAESKENDLTVTAEQASPRALDSRQVAAPDLTQHKAIPVSRVLPCFHNIDTWLHRNVDQSYADKNFTHHLIPVEADVVLMVGRIAPNKNYEALIKALALYGHSYEKTEAVHPCYLVLAGALSPDLELYNQKLRQMIAAYRIEHRVIFTDRISDQALLALYERATIFCSLSLHEGFCVPIVEALANRLPVATVDRGAIPETLGHAGIVLDSDDPHLVAAAWHKLLVNEDLAQELAQAGVQRYQNKFTNSIIAEQFAEIMEQLL